MKYSFIPHMMPMMWMFTFTISLSILFITMSMIYFFYLPTILSNNKSINFKNKSNWIWKW